MSNVPVEKQVWNSQECADYLRESRDSFMRTTRFMEKFPKPLPMSGKGHPKWSAGKVIEWALTP